MTLANIGWLISSIIWAICTVINFVSNRRGNIEMAGYSLYGMFISLGFMFATLFWKS